MTWEEFSAGFDKCFDRVYAYVSRRMQDPRSCERIVAEVLAENLDVLANPGDDDTQQLRRLKAASDRLIELESARALPTGTLES